MEREQFARDLAEHAYLEGDFVLRSGRRSRYYLDKYRFETRPELLGPLGTAIAEAVDEVEPDAARLAGPELGAVALAASASLASGLPFVIVRKEAKDYGTANRLEGTFDEGELVCLVEDVVTSGGAAAEAVDNAMALGMMVRAALGGPPVLARLPLTHNTAELAVAAAQAGADALVVAAPPRTEARADGETVRGRLYGPGCLTAALAAVREVAALNLGRPIIGVGGIYSVEAAQAMLEAGAVAVQIDAAIWTRPKIIEEMRDGALANH